MGILNERLEVQKVAVTEKSAACEEMLEEISENSTLATEKKQLAEAKGKDIAVQSVVIVKEKVCV